MSKNVCPTTRWVNNKNSIDMDNLKKKTNLKNKICSDFEEVPGPETQFNALKYKFINWIDVNQSFLRAHWSQGHS